MIHEFNQEGNSKIPNRSPCPSCMAVLNLRSGFSINAEDNRGPSPGDFILCPACGEFFKLNESLAPIKPSDADLEEISQDPISTAARNSIMLRIGKITEKDLGQAGIMGQAYFNKCELMLNQVKEWREKNKTLSPAIQYNFDDNTVVCATIPDAIDNHFMSINNDAKTMLHELGWLTPNKDMPSVLMLRAVLDKAFN